MKKVLVVLSVFAIMVSATSCFIVKKDNGNHKGQNKEHKDNGKHKGKK